MPASWIRHCPTKLLAKLLQTCLRYCYTFVLAGFAFPVVRTPAHFCTGVDDSYVTVIAAKLGKVRTLIRSLMNGRLGSLDRGLVKNSVSTNAGR